MLRVRISRAISRRILKSDHMVCAELSLRRHWSEPYIDVLFLAMRGETRHSERCADWEAATAPDPMAEHRFTPQADVTGWRRAGLL